MRNCFSPFSSFSANIGLMYEWAARITHIFSEIRIKEQNIRLMEKETPVSFRNRRPTIVSSTPFGEGELLRERKVTGCDPTGGIRGKFNDLIP